MSNGRIILKLSRCPQATYLKSKFISSFLRRFKGAPARESRTGTRLVSPDTGCQKKTPLEQGLRTQN